MPVKNIIKNFANSKEIQLTVKSTRSPIQNTSSRSDNHGGGHFGQPLFVAMPYGETNPQNMGRLAPSFPFSLPLTNTNPPSMPAVPVTFSHEEQGHD